MSRDTTSFSCTHEVRGPRMHSRPGLSEINYRIGTQPEFLHRMLTDLSHDKDLARLTTRELSDPAISLLDSWAVVLDILTFYNERIANEGWLRTATTRWSVRELARQVGYELNPGVSAHAYLAFMVQASPGGGEVYPMSAGLKVQSIPGPNELPQIFETMALLEARPEFNAMPLRNAIPQVFGRRTVSVWLDGTDTRLQLGDVLLMVGGSRRANPGSEQWDLRTVHSIDIDDLSKRTKVTWREDLGHTNPSMEPEANPDVFAFDVRANLFGHNAPDARTIPLDIPTQDLINGGEWDEFSIHDPSAKTIDLDTEYEDILADSWIILEQGNLRELYRVESTTTVARTDFTLTAKSVRLKLDTDENLANFGLRGTIVRGASRHLPRTVAPLQTPVTGDELLLDGDHPAFAEGQLLLLHGRLLTEAVVAPRGHVFRTAAVTAVGSDPALNFLPDNGGPIETLAELSRLSILGPPKIIATGATAWHVALSDGREGTVLANMGEDLTPLQPEPAEDAFAPTDEALYENELIEIRRLDRTDERTIVTLVTPLTGLYWRPSVTLNGNVVSATHGDTRYELTSALTGQRFTETLGSGDASQTMQSFRLSQKPLTYTQSNNPSGGTTSLVVRVDGVAWQEVDTLYGQASDARVFSTQPATDGHMIVQFGDGNFGVRIPAGQGNVVATYRVGIGLSGLVRARQLSLAMDQPLGLESVTNPLPSTGAQDPEKLEDARQNAPLTVLTLDRIVSIRDFEDYARAFAGVSKAQASPIWSGERQIVHITAVGIKGVKLTAEDTTLVNLRIAIDSSRHSERPVVVDGHIERRFGLTIKVAAEPGREVAPILEQLRQTLLTRYGLEGQTLAQGVETSELIATAQSVPGIAAVILADLDGSLPATLTRVTARRARWDATQGSFQPAELLLINETDLTIEEMNL